MDRYIASHPIVGATRRQVVLELASQVWQGKEWHHLVTEATPAKLRHRGFAVLAVTGGVRNQKDMDWAKRIAAKAGIPVFSVFDVPNQPIWDLWEDGLVAHSFDQCLKTNDESWPLLFPMANSAIRAMDAIQRDSAKRSNPIRKFVITGESKRGWTTWLLGTVQDKRIVGIAPFIYDNLNIPAQLEHQQELWGRYSPMYQAYQEQGLLDILETMPGKRLIAMVDPYSRIGRLKVPVLNVIGSNDPFWSVDATGLYWGKIRTPKSLVVMPNKGHDFPGDVNSENALAAFARSCAGEFRFPDTSQILLGPLSVIKLRPPSRQHATMRAWSALAQGNGFSLAKWQPSKDPAKIELPNPESGASAAVSVEARYRISDLEFSLFTPPKILTWKAAK